MRSGSRAERDRLERSDSRIAGSPAGEINVRRLAGLANSGGARQLEIGQKRGIVVFMSVEEIKKGIESLSEAELGEVASFLSDLRREVSGRMAPDELGKLAHRLAGNKSRAESVRLTSQIVDGFYSGS